MGTIVTTPMYLLLYPSTDDFPPIPNVIVQFVAGTILGLQLRGTPPRDMRVATLTGWPVALTGMLLVFFGLAGGRRGARFRSSETGHEMLHPAV